MAYSQSSGVRCTIITEKSDKKKYLIYNTLYEREMTRANNFSITYKKAHRLCPAFIMGLGSSLGWGRRPPLNQKKRTRGASSHGACHENVYVWGHWWTSNYLWCEYGMNNTLPCGEIMWSKLLAGLGWSRLMYPRSGVGPHHRHARRHGSKREARGPTHLLYTRPQWIPTHPRCSVWCREPPFLHYSVGWCRGFAWRWCAEVKPRPIACQRWARERNWAHRNPININVMI